MSCDDCADEFCEVWTAIRSIRDQIAAHERATPSQRADADAGDLEARVATLEDDRGHLALTDRDLAAGIRGIERQVSDLRDRLARTEVRGVAPERTCDLLSFLCSIDGCLDCDPDGTIRVIFDDETAIPLETVEEAAAHLRRHDPNGRISVVADGGLVVELRPAAASDERGNAPGGTPPKWIYIGDDESVGGCECRGRAPLFGPCMDGSCPGKIRGACPFFASGPKPEFESMFVRADEEAAE